MRDQSELETEGGIMDLLFFGCVLGFFAATWGFVRLCERV